MKSTSYQISQEHINTVLNLIPDGIKFTLDGVKTNPMIITLNVEGMSTEQLSQFSEGISRYKFSMF